MKIVWASTREEAARLAAEGFEPVECSFGVGDSVVGEFAMDHHGDESWREGVALRAYRDHFAARKKDPRFVVTGAADEDATFAIAALAGVLPHPRRLREMANAPESLRTALTADLSALAELINHYDTAPIGLRLEESDLGAAVLLWGQMDSEERDALAFYAGVDRWKKLCVNPPRHLLAAVREGERRRVLAARQAPVTRVSDEVALVESTEWGFDVWYELARVIVSYQASGVVTIGCPNAETAESLFGPGGLKNVFPALAPGGWGGRESIGGSPRGRPLTREEALDAARVIAQFVLHPDMTRTAAPGLS